MMTKKEQLFIDWQKTGGLVPAIVQDSENLQVLMLGFMNSEALEKTLKTRCVTFYSRTKARLWTKGETSGNLLHVQSIQVDCDNDTLLIMASPEGNTCHKGTKTCFGMGDEFSLKKLERIIDERINIKAEQESYVKRLTGEGIYRLAQKVGEEGVEVALAATKKLKDNNELVSEAGDLLFHLIVLLRYRKIAFDDIITELEERHRKQ